MELSAIAPLPLATLHLVCDLILATTIAATLRGFTGSHSISASIILLVMLLIVASSSKLGVWSPPFPALLEVFSPPAGLRRLLLTLGVCVALLPLLQRAWLKADLSQLARRAHAPD